MLYYTRSAQREEGGLYYDRLLAPKLLLLDQRRNAEKQDVQRWRREKATEMDEGWQASLSFVRRSGTRELFPLPPFVGVLFGTENFFFSFTFFFLLSSLVFVV